MNILIKDIAQYKDKVVTLRGWVFNARSSGKIAFLELRDGSGFVQAIFEKSAIEQASTVSDTNTKNIWQTATEITIESSVAITGTVKQHPKKPSEYELQANDIKVYQKATEYPIGKKDHGPDFLLNNRHLWIRSKKQWAILRIRAGIYKAIEDFLNSNNFTRFDSPILTPSACEGTTELFELDYFDEGKAYLSQSGQLYLEAGIGSLARVYDFGPVFRAEKSKTRRHLTEFWMMDAEMAFFTHEENMQLQENLVSFVVKKILADYATELTCLERALDPLKKIQAPFERMTHAQAVSKVQALGSDIKRGEDLGADDEALLTQKYDKPVFVEKYPANVKAFYMKRCTDDESLVLCNDLLAPEGYGEVFGGSVREDNYDKLLSRIKEHKLPKHDFEWYLDTRRFGSIPHAGFGIGLERMVAWICGIHHVRETIPFPRMISRKTP